MTKLTPAPALPSVAKSAALVAATKTEIAASKAEIDQAESERDAKVLSLTDEAFEARRSDDRA